MLIKNRAVMVSVLLLCLILSFLILIFLNFRENEMVMDTVLEDVVEDKVKFLPETSTSIFVNVYGTSTELNHSDTKVDIVLDASMMTKIESLSDNAILSARDTLVEAEVEEIRHVEPVIVEEVQRQMVNYNSGRIIEPEKKVEPKKEEPKKEEPKKQENTTTNVSLSIEDRDNIVFDSNVSGIVTTTVGKFTFTYDPTVVPVNKENIEARFKVYAPNDDYNKVVKALAQMVFGEARGCADTEIAATIWCVLNRYDAGYANSIFKVVTAEGQFHGYSPNHKVYDDIYEITVDVIARWIAEKEGATNVGRILPADYLWFGGDGKHNHFRNAYKTSNRWDWSLPTPYIDWE